MNCDGVPHGFGDLGYGEPTLVALFRETVPEGVRRECLAARLRLPLEGLPGAYPT
jgi:hypothetical protein